MDETKRICCNIKGTGKILRNDGQPSDFELVDLCTEGARIYTAGELETGNQVKTVIILHAILFDVEINTDAVILQKSETEDGFIYELEFIGLPEKDRREIGEIVSNTCGVF